MPWTPGQGLLAEGVVAAMRDVQFRAAGAVRSYWDFYQGFGLAISVLLAVEALALWQLATLVRAGADCRAMAATHMAGFVLLGLVAARYIFALPLWLALAIATCLGLALLRPESRPSPALG
jgi:hypothetical protein